MSPLNNEPTNTNGAIKPCQRPSQKPANSPCSLAIFPDGLGPGAHPARMLSSRTSTSTVKEVFLAIPPALTLLRGTGMKGFRRTSYRAMHLFQVLTRIPVSMDGSASLSASKLTAAAFGAGDRGSSYRFAGRSARLIAALMLSRLGNQKTEDKT
jgi:hypothetical protein